MLLAELAHRASLEPETAVVWVSWERESWSGSELDILRSESALRGHVHLFRHASDEPRSHALSLPERALAFVDGLLASPHISRIHLVFFEHPGTRASVAALWPALHGRSDLLTFIVSPWELAVPAVLKPPFDALIAFDPSLAKQRLYPALDPAQSCSRLADHAAELVAHAARRLLLEDSERARLLRAYLTQPFVVAAPHVGRPGEHVARLDMLADVAALLEGAADGTPLGQVLYRGRASWT